MRSAMKTKMLVQAKDATDGSGAGATGVAEIAYNGISDPSNPGILQPSTLVKLEEVV